MKIRKITGKDVPELIVFIRKGTFDDALTVGRFISKLVKNPDSEIAYNIKKQKDGRWNACWSANL